MDSVFFGRISEIWRYPVSSLGGERLEEAPLDRGGIRHDRIWGALTRESGEIAEPEGRKPWRPLPNLLARMAPDGPEVKGPDTGWMPVSSPEAAAVASDFLGFPVAFRPHVPFGTEEPGRIAPRFERADIHLLTTASMQALAEIVGKPGEVDPRRFRPNIVVETDPGFTGFVEHDILGRTLAIGDARLSITEPCARCTFTALAQGDLSFMPAVLHAISRHGAGGFGALCKVETPATIRVGDPLRLI